MKFIVFVYLLVGQLASNLCNAALPCAVDVAFLVDSSASIGHHNYEKEKAFVKETASLLGIPTHSRGAVIVFGDDAKLSIDFHQAKTRQQFDNLVQNIPYMSRRTRIDKALILAAKEVFPKARKHVVKIALVITDGKLTKMRDTIPLLNVSRPLRENGVRVLVVGIGINVNKNELEEMVEKPEDMFLTDNFDSLTRRVQEIVNYTCNNAVLQECLSLSRSHCAREVREREKDLMSFLNGIASLDVEHGRSLQNATFLLDDLLNALQSGRHLHSIPKSYIMCCVSRMEEFSFRFAARHLEESNHSIKMETDRIVFDAKRIANNSSKEYTFPNTDENKYGAMVVLPTKHYTDKDSFVVSILYKSLHRYLQQALDIHHERDNGGQLGTRVLSVTVKPPRKKMAPNVTLRFETLPSLKTHHTSNQTCVFWDFTFDEKDKWSKQGCMVSRQDEHMTECSCNHLTHFGILMQIQEQTLSKTDEDALSIITYIGLGLSLLGCALTILLYFAFVNLRAQLSQIRINLVVSIAIGQIIFIAGIDATQNLGGCIAVAVFIQYFYLVAFCWMLVEGVQLYLHVVKVFNIEHGMVANYIFAWGFPSIVVMATVIAALTSKDGAAGLINERFCWLSFKNKLAWTFAGPILAITLINIILLLHVIREMSKMHDTIGGSTSQLSIVRKTAKACIVLFPLLGITWLFGILTMSEVGVTALYIFTILNSTQGFLIFILSCVRNSEIRSKVHAKLQSLHLSKPSGSSVMPNPEVSPEPCPPRRDRMIMTDNKRRENFEPSRL
ncbi:adhesion G-protein coupled receptor D1-like isoform X1 [Actinia tenebrosa]|uniref:Adhesion G-protein coupled receptor D1-like isoform X1 n=1 Tax=Actinia tenebrosa TaxID=6105 RepID=A0A6P8HLD5_ACTTE|nr:adhesion G-protein coupled receptor D1-like isoform X1 [Actinia tenebrosa]